ncbi:MAG: hypothetical protein ACK5SI_01145, partial [Planctomycetia bacterium]
MTNGSAIESRTDSGGPGPVSSTTRSTLPAPAADRESGGLDLEADAGVVAPWPRQVADLREQGI